MRKNYKDSQMYKTVGKFNSIYEHLSYIFSVLSMIVPKITDFFKKNNYIMYFAQ